MSKIKPGSKVRGKAAKPSYVIKADKVDDVRALYKKILQLVGDEDGPGLARLIKQASPKFGAHIVERLVNNARAVQRWG